LYTFLSPRLRLAFDRFPEKAKNYIDIGTDHGYLPAALLLAGKIQFATATDINFAPLERARQMAERFGLTEKMRFVEAAGLEFDYVVPDVISICGMGGLMIADIIEKANLPDCLLFLQPMTKIEDLRLRLMQMGYGFDESYAIEGDKVFVMIRAAKEGIPKKDADLTDINAALYAGFPEKGQEHSKEYMAYIDKIIRREKKKLAGLLLSENKMAQADEVAAVLQHLERIYNVI